MEGVFQHGTPALEDLATKDPGSAMNQDLRGALVEILTAGGALTSD